MTQSKNCNYPLISDNDIDSTPIIDWIKDINGTKDESFVNRLDSDLSNLKTGSVKELGHLQEHTGKNLDIKDSISGPATSLKLFGDTRIIKPKYTGKNLLNILKAENTTSGGGG